MTYVKCPICGETDTDKTEYENGLVIISCSNRDCASNGGSNYSFLKKTLDEKANPSLQLDIVHRGTSGIEIQALLSKKYSLIEYSLKAEPVPIFISPWMQFEPSEMNDERLQIAYEIARRVTAHDSLLKENTRLRRLIEADRAREDRWQKQRDATFDMWKADRVKMGLPADFSDITVWPEELMSGYV